MTEVSAINAEIAEIIERRKEALAEAAVARCRQSAPALEERYGDRGRRKCIEDVTYHLSYLSTAIAMSCPELFADYLAWAKALLAGVGVPMEDVVGSLEALSGVLEEELPPEMGEIIREYVAVGVHELTSASAGPACFLDSGESLAELTRQYVDLLLQGNRQAASRLILDAVESGTKVREIYLH